MMKKRIIWITAVMAIILIAVSVFLLIPRVTQKQKGFMDKASIIKGKILTDAILETLKDPPLESSDYALFFSSSDGSSRAKVFTGKGKKLSDAWDDAVNNTVKAMDNQTPDPVWLRVDVVSNAWQIDARTLKNEISNSSSGFDFICLALDNNFDVALLEGELNGRGIYDYKEDELSLSQLNEWLEEKGKTPLTEVPEKMTAFRCLSWFCDENNEVLPLYTDGADTGRRMFSSLDADYAKEMIDTASTFLMNQVKSDGSFIYGIYPQYDEEIDNYNILRHSGTIWSLICRYRMFPDKTLKDKIERTIDYMLGEIRYDDSGAAYLHEAKDYEYKLGGNGIAIVALTEYMDVFQNDNYREICISLGEGILKQQNPDTGHYWHILNNDMSRGEDFRTIYYDGECTFALARLYSLTGDQKWLDAACKAIDMFIREDYTQYRDHWVAYSLNEVTKYIDRQEYYDFALANAVNNYERIMDRERTYPTNLELLISSFETWQRMVDRGYDTGEFNVRDLLTVISARANRQLSGYFYPELAMYMANPQHILGSFMMRNDKFRVRIDDVQHNIGGFYLYWKNYDLMVAAGLDAGSTDYVQKGN